MARRNKLEPINTELAVKTEEVEISSEFDNFLSIKEKFKGVSLKNLDNTSDKVQITGPANEVEEAKPLLLQMTKKLQLSSFSCEIRISPQFQGFLIGKNGKNIKKLCEQTGARIILPGKNDVDKEIFTIVGCKEAVEATRIKIEASIEYINKMEVEEIEVEAKYHRHFIARHGEVLKRVSEDCGGVQLIFPKNGVQSNNVVLKGSKECIKAAVQRINEIVADLKARVTIECVIPHKHHGIVIGKNWLKVRGISAEHNVQINFPERVLNEEAQLNDNVEVAASEDQHNTTPNPCDIILIHGYPENCNAAKEALLKQVPVTVEVPMLNKILGQKRRKIHEIMTNYGVYILLPTLEEKHNLIKISGVLENVEEAKKAIEEMCLKLFEIKLQLNSYFYPIIIGKNGAIISKISNYHDVQIIFPESGKPKKNIIIINGLKNNVFAACDDIMKIVNDKLHRVDKNIPTYFLREQSSTQYSSLQISQANPDVENINQGRSRWNQKKGTK